MGLRQGSMFLPCEPQVGKTETPPEATLLPQGIPRGFQLGGFQGGSSGFLGVPAGSWGFLGGPGGSWGVMTVPKGS